MKIQGNKFFSPQAHQKFSFLSVVLILLLFLFGGIVRTTGSGMGCPDWPKCFGEIFPPTSIDALPKNYKALYVQERIAKMERFAKILKATGFENKANEIMASTAVYEAHDYNFSKAYTEYINRIVGMMTGIFALLACISSFQFLKCERRKFFCTLLGFFFVFLNAFIGALVVASNLVGGIVTVHFLLSFAAVFFFLLVIPNRIHFPKKNMSFALAILLIVLGIQVVLGTQIREKIDILSRDSAFSLNSDSVSLLGDTFTYHQVLGYVLLAISAFLVFFFRKPETKKIQRVFTLFLILGILQNLSGVVNANFDLPWFSQLIHIVLGSIVFTLLLFFAISYWGNVKKTSV